MLASEGDLDPFQHARQGRKGRNVGWRDEVAANTDGEASNILNGSAGDDRLSASASATGPRASASNDLSGGEGDDLLTATVSEFGGTNILSAARATIT